MSDMTHEDEAWLDDLLANPSTWTEPAADLEDSVVAAVAEAPVVSTPASKPAAKSAAPRRWRTALSAVAVAAAIIAVVGFVAVRDTTNPDFQAQLSATELAPGASGSVDMVKNDSGFRINLDASELPERPNGEFYQAWLKNADDVLVPIGSFSSSDDEVILWSGVDPAEFSAFSVTIEKADGDQASSGKRVLAGPVSAG